MSERSDPAQFGLFELTRRGPAGWVYPCRSCDVMVVVEAGGLSEACAPVMFGEPARRQASARKPKNRKTVEPAEPKPARQAAARPGARARKATAQRGGGSDA